MGSSSSSSSSSLSSSSLSSSSVDPSSSFFSSLSSPMSPFGFSVGHSKETLERNSALIQFGGRFNSGMPSSLFQNQLMNRSRTRTIPHQGTHRRCPISLSPPYLASLIGLPSNPSPKYNGTDDYYIPYTGAFSPPPPSTSKHATHTHTLSTTIHLRPIQSAQTTPIQSQSIRFPASDEQHPDDHGRRFGTWQETKE